MFKNSLRSRIHSSMNHKEYIENIEPFTPILKPMQAPNLMCIPEIELPPPQINLKPSHFRNNSNPEQNKDDDLDLIRNDFSPISHLKTQLQIKLTINSTNNNYQYQNDSCINFDKLENTQTQFSKNLQEMEKEKINQYSKSFQILNFASEIKEKLKEGSCFNFTMTTQSLDWMLE